MEADRYAIDYDHTFGGWGVVEAKTGLFVGHTGTQAGARVMCRNLNKRHTYLPVFSTENFSVRPLTESEIHEDAEIWGETITQLKTPDGNKMFVVFGCEFGDREWRIYA
jgi:hypothetical protein